jgi:UDP:flavonoid glycosyltransferase YjiC (YdhE family)
MNLNLYYWLIFYVYLVIFDLPVVFFWLFFDLSNNNTVIKKMKCGCFVYEWWTSYIRARDNISEFLRFSILKFNVKIKPIL